MTSIVFKYIWPQKEGDRSLYLVTGMELFMTLLVWNTKNYAKCATLILTLTLLTVSTKRRLTHANIRLCIFVLCYIPWKKCHLHVPDCVALAKVCLVMFEYEAKTEEMESSKSRWTQSVVVRHWISGDMICHYRSPLSRTSVPIINMSSQLIAAVLTPEESFRRGFEHRACV